MSPAPDRQHEPPYGNGGILTYRVDELKRRLDEYERLEIPRVVDRLESRVKATQQEGNIRDNRLWKIETTLEDMDLRGLRRDVQSAMGLLSDLGEKVDKLQSTEDVRTQVKAGRPAWWIIVPVITGLLLAIYTFVQPFIGNG